MSRTRVRPPSPAATTSSGTGRQPTALGGALANRGPRALVEHLTLAQDDRAIGDAIGERHLVRRQQDRGPARLGVKQQLDQQRLRRRILLHQAAEHIYQAILLAFMGYKPCTHNLDKLRRYTHRFSIELAFLFPRDGAGEDRLFKLLLQSYVDARYKEDYQVTENELQQLTQRIEKLLAIAGRICHNRFISLEKMAAMEGAHLGGR